MAKRLDQSAVKELVIYEGERERARKFNFLIACSLHIDTNWFHKLHELNFIMLQSLALWFHPLYVFVALNMYVLEL